MEKEKLLEFIKKLIKKYSETNGKIIFDKEFIQEYLFIDNGDGTKSINDDFYHMLRANSCDMSGVSFKDVHVKEHYFNGLKNVEINIDEIPNKDISYTNLNGVKVTGSLDGAYITHTKFKGYIGSLVLNPQLVKDKDLYFCDLDGLTINGSFDGCNICMIRFQGAKGTIRVNPQRVKDKDISCIDFNGVEIVGDPIEGTNAPEFKKPSFDGCRIYDTSFPGCKGRIIIFPSLVKGKKIQLSDLSNVELAGSLDGVDLLYSSLSEGTSAKLMLERKKKEESIVEQPKKKSLWKRR